MGAVGTRTKKVSESRLLLTMLKSVASFLSAHWMWVSIATFLAFPVWNERKEVVFMSGVQPIKPVSIAANIR